MMIPDFGTVVFAAIPFSNQHEIKMRPAVAVSSKRVHASYGDIILLSITSQLDMDLPFTDLRIVEWQQAGLPKPSAFKPALVTLEPIKISHVFGKLSESDSQRLKKLLTEMLVL